MTRCLFMVATLLFTAIRVFGSLVVTEVDATNIQTMPFVISVKPTDHGKRMLFRVVAARHLPDQTGGAAMDFSFESATLSAYEGTNFISSCSVSCGSVPSDMQRSGSVLAKSGIMFEFIVSTNCLTSSRFEIAYVSGRYPAIAAYRFRLETFIHGR